MITCDIKLTGQDLTNKLVLDGLKEILNLISNQPDNNNEPLYKTAPIDFELNPIILDQLTPGEARLLHTALVDNFGNDIKLTVRDDQDRPGMSRIISLTTTHITSMRNYAKGWLRGSLDA